MILMYHRVASLSLDAYGLAVSPATFLAQMTVLKRQYRPVPLDELIAVAHQGEEADDRVAITFDDGYIDNLTTASPILVEAGLPATFFLTTDGLDERREYWWDVTARVLLEDRPVPSRLDLYGDGTWTRPTATSQERADAHVALNDVLRPLPADARSRLVDSVIRWSGLDPAPQEAHRPLMTDEVRALARRPRHAIGAHTARHLWLPAQPAAVQRHEIQESKDALEGLLDQPVRAFAYPFGAVDAETRRIVAEIGLTSAVTTQAGRIHADVDPLLLPRVEVRDEDADAFIARLNAVPRGVTA